MNAPCYSTVCTVIKSVKEADMFYMNMRVFDVFPYSGRPSAPGEPMSSIWCAVYHVNKPGLIGGISGPSRS